MSTWQSLEDVVGSLLSSVAVTRQASPKPDDETVRKSSRGFHEEGSFLN